MHLPLQIGNQKQLFIDDYCIAELSGVHRQLNQPSKHPANPLLIPEMPWEKTYVQLYGNVLFDANQQQFRMWYSARDVDRINTVCHATSKDGIHWERSHLHLINDQDYEWSNALIKGQYIGPTVFHTPDDPDPQRQYRMFTYMGPELLNAEDRHTAFGHAYGILFSPDGIHWTEYENNPVIQGGDIATCCYDPITQDYLAFPKIHSSGDGIDRRCVGVSASKDFVQWSAPVLILSANADDDARTVTRLNRFRNILAYDSDGQHGYPSADIYGMTGFRYEGLRLGLIWFYDRSALRPSEHGGNDDGVINIQLAYSRGGCWHRVHAGEDFLSCGDEGDYDHGMIVTAHSVVDAGDELRFYYTGIDHSHGWEDRADRPSRLSRQPVKGASINLATLRKDGFVSLDALYPEGKVTTKPLIFQSDELEINADAEHGYILVEITDENGKPIPGFAKTDCIPFKENTTCGIIKWKTRRSLTALQGKPIHLTFFLQTAKLYAFQFNIRES